jgi:L-ascorbate metabolism protein UlaG (beta-lactamase superfamily)
VALQVKALGQTGYKFIFNDLITYIDPYLSNYVEEVEGKQARRLKSVVIEPENINDAKWVFITHSHIDHCDPRTLIPISKSSPQCKFIGPYDVCLRLKEFGIEDSRIVVAMEEWIRISSELEILAVPAAHPEIKRDTDNNLSCIGFVFKHEKRNIYHSGDTIIDVEIVDTIKKNGGAEIAFLSVNEKNYYRDKLGIIGNMSVRDAFGFADEIGARIVVPMHWDMFELNRVYPEEIRLLYEKIKPDFKLILDADSMCL